MIRNLLCAVMVILTATAPMYAQVSPEEAMRLLKEQQKSATGPDFIQDAGFNEFVKGKQLFVEVPIQGGFGEEVTADAVEEILEYCANDPHIGHVVFTINSPGGVVQEAERILQAMQKHKDKLYYHAVVEHAISAAIWVVFGSDTIWIREGGTVGGAVIFRQLETGNLDVNEKLNSIFLARIEATAQAKGHPKELARAMVLASEELYAYTDEDGKVRLSNQKPGNIPPSRVQQIDNNKTVVTLTRDKAIEIQFARGFDGSVDNLGKVIGYEGGWHRANNYGHVAMILMNVETIMDWQAEMIESIPEPEGRAATRSRMLIRKLKTDMRSLADSVSHARKNDPERVLHLYDPVNNKVLVPDVEAWRKQVREARRHWAGAVRFYKSIGDIMENTKNRRWMSGYETLSKGFDRIKDIETRGYTESTEFFGTILKNSTAESSKEEDSTTNKRAPLPGQ